MLFIIQHICMRTRILQKDPRELALWFVNRAMVVKARHGNMREDLLMNGPLYRCRGAQAALRYHPLAGRADAVQAIYSCLALPPVVMFLQDHNGFGFGALIPELSPGYDRRVAG
jgi:hypothetical protein